jgi:hypothetical protein
MVGFVDCTVELARERTMRQLLSNLSASWSFGGSSAEFGNSVQSSTRKSLPKIVDSLLKKDANEVPLEVLATNPYVSSFQSSFWQKMVISHRVALAIYRKQIYTKIVPDENIASPENPAEEKEELSFIAVMMRILIQVFGSVSEPALVTQVLDNVVHVLQSKPGEPQEALPIPLPLNVNLQSIKNEPRSCMKTLLEWFFSILNNPDQQSNHIKAIQSIVNVSTASGSLNLLLQSILELWKQNLRFDQPSQESIKNILQSFAPLSHACPIVPIDIETHQGIILQN